MLDKKTTLFNVGRELFLDKGFKAVNVSDITKKANLSVGTFYNYYSSKQELFSEIYYEENKKSKKEILDNININDNPTKVMLSFLNEIANKSNLILDEWYKGEVIGDLEKGYLIKNDDSNNYVHSFLKELLIKWRKDGKLKDEIDNVQIMELYKAIIYLDTHKEETKIDSNTLLLLSKFIIIGITK